MKRTLFFVYGLVCYAVTLATFAYLAGFVGNVLTPTRLDAPASGSLGIAVVVNLSLLLLFGLQHSVMARPTFKRVWTKLVPQPIERSTYCLLSCVALAMLFWQWRPMGGVIWDVQHEVGRAAILTVYSLGWLVVLATTFLINHFDLFGLRQVWMHLRGKWYTPPAFTTPGPYKRVRHPLYLGWMIVFWATPVMTVAHLAFAAGLTAYMIIAIYFEERNLAEHYGQRYVEWKKQTPMLIPRRRRRPVEPRLATT